MSGNIEKMNMKSMMKMLHGEMKRIKSLKCPADVDMVKKHTEDLEYLKDRTARIETAGYVTIALVTLFGVIVGVIQYSNYKLVKEQAKDSKPMPSIVSKSDLTHGIY